VDHAKSDVSDFLIGHDGAKMQMLISRLPQLFGRKAQSNAAAVRKNKNMSPNLLNNHPRFLKHHNLNVTDFKTAANFNPK
jgi:hypothetical protein